MPGPTPTPPQTFLQLVAACDNCRVGSSEEHIIPWLLYPTPSSPAIGLLRPEIVAQLRKDNESSSTPLWVFGNPDESTSSRGWVSFAQGIATPAARTRIMQELCERWRDTGLWPEMIGPSKWRAERYPVYRNPFGAHDYPTAAGEGERDELNYAFEMERAATALFGIVAYGIHVNVYEQTRKEGGEGVAGPAAEEYSVWVPRRAATKQTWPLYLDNSVSGGLSVGLSVFECVVKESMEEASLPEDVVKRYARPVGCLSYFFRTPRGWLQPEIEHIYDLCLPCDSGTRPEPLDGEVESFELLPLSEVEKCMRTGLFKYSCSPVLIDFMIRHGLITPDNEPSYYEIVTRLHGRFDYDRWALL